MLCIATFYSHFGAVRFKKRCEAAGAPARMMPVPRNLSSSCGTCVRFEIPDDKALASSSKGLSLPSGAIISSWLSALLFDHGTPSDEIEQVVEVLGEGYRNLYHVDES